MSARVVPLAMVAFWGVVIVVMSVRYFTHGTLPFDTRSQDGQLLYAFLVLAVIWNLSRYFRALRRPRTNPDAAFRQKLLARRKPDPLPPEERNPELDFTRPS